MVSTGLVDFTYPVLCKRIRVFQRWQAGVALTQLLVSSAPHSRQAQAEGKAPLRNQPGSSETHLEWPGLLVVAVFKCTQVKQFIMNLFSRALLSQFIQDCNIDEPRAERESFLPAVPLNTGGKCGAAANDCSLLRCPHVLADAYIFLSAWEGPRG
jgi:hypothetical protein